VREAIPQCNIPKVKIDESRELINVDTRDPSAGPVVFVMAADRNKQLREKVLRNVLLKNHGDVEVILSSSNSYSQATQRMSLRNYIETIVDVDEKQALEATSDSRFYMFGHNDARDPWKDFGRDLYVRPPCGPTCSGSNFATPTLGIGSRNSGTSFHFHGSAFSETIIGRKRWLIFPLHLKPDMRTLANMTMWRWIENVLPSMDSRENIWDCIISPGEVLWFPSQYYHATLNVDEYNCFMSLFI